MGAALSVREQMRIAEEMTEEKIGKGHCSLCIFNLLFEGIINM